MMNRKQWSLFSAAALVISLAAGTTAGAADGAFSIALSEDNEAWNYVAMANDDEVKTGIVVRSAMDTESPAVGYLYRGGGVTVLDQDNGWTKIRSGNVTGYVRSEYLTFGTEAKGLAEYYGEYGVKASWDDVKVFAADNKDAKIVGTANDGDTYPIVNNNGHWLEVRTGEDETAYVSQEDTDLVILVDSAYGINEDEAPAASRKKSSASKKEQPQADAQVKEQKSTGSEAAKEAAPEVSGEEPVYEEPVQEASYTEPAYEESVQEASYTEPAYEEPVQEASYTEPVYEEPAQEASYTEPAYEEPAQEASYTEPAYEEPAQEASYTEPAQEETYQEPAYEEPVQEASYTEPVQEETYQEPAYEETSYEETSYVEEAQDDSYEDTSSYDVVYEEEGSDELMYEDNSYTDNEVYDDDAYTDDSTYTQDGSYTEESTYTDDSAYVDDSAYADDGSYTEDTGYSEDTGYAEESSSTSSTGSSDVDLLAAIIYHEAGNQPEEGKIAVGAVVLNRVNSSSFPGTISEVLYQPGQFTPAGELASTIASGVPSSCYDAAYAALGGQDPTGGCLYFNTSHGSGVHIGAHWFY